MSGENNEKRADPAAQPVLVKSTGLRDCAIIVHYHEALTGFLRLITVSGCWKGQTHYDKETGGILKCFGGYFNSFFLLQICIFLCRGKKFNNLSIRAAKQVGESGDGCNMAYFFNQEWAAMMIFILHMLNQPPILPGWNQAHVTIPCTKNNFHGKKSIFFIIGMKHCNNMWFISDFLASNRHS